MFALALDGNKQPCRVKGSNAGQCLFTGIAKPEHARRMVQSPPRAGAVLRLGDSHNRLGRGAL